MREFDLVLTLEEFLLNNEKWLDIRSQVVQQRLGRPYAFGNDEVDDDPEWWAETAKVEQEVLRRVADRTEFGE